MPRKLNTVSVYPDEKQKAIIDALAAHESRSISNLLIKLAEEKADELGLKDSYIKSFLREREDEGARQEHRT